MSAPRVFVGPDGDAAMADAARRGGGQVVDAARDADLLVWTGHRPDELAPLLHAGVRWVQLSSAGVEHWLESGVVDGARTWLSAADAYSASVAEHALALLLAAVHRLGEAARAETWDPGLGGRTLRGMTVAIVGAGGIGRALIALLAPHDVEVVAVRRSDGPVEGAARTVSAGRLREVWGEADAVVVAAPATSTTRHLVDEQALHALPEGAVVVNVARGSLVDTDALVRALAAGRLGGAALDVTDPEPLPDGHPLWREPRALVTPHVANPESAWTADLAARVEENVRRIAEGREPVAVIDPGRGY